jgi:protein-L-isoaspartate(D-aspartate) O-methyltransferase
MTGWTSDFFQKKFVGLHLCMRRRRGVPASRIVPASFYPRDVQHGSDDGEAGTIAAFHELQGPDRSGRPIRSDTVNLEHARSNMIEQQVRTWEVLDARVLDVLRSVPREDYTPATHRKLAFSDLRIPLEGGQVMMKPIEEGRCLQSLALEGGEQVLEVGTGSGFLTACLAALGAEVVSLEIVPVLAEQARRALDAHGVQGVEVQQADVLTSDFEEGRFDAIVVTASVSSIPESFGTWLKPGGRMFIVRGTSPAMEALRVERTAGGRLAEESLFDTDLPRLTGAEDVPTFEF